ncbi:hypothetical protein GCM10018791_60600 [Streptomyces zaomyceticus]|nr:hypothetical protein GCM10018791_60600 [Streptomyces zaomyceticus]
MHDGHGRALGGARLPTALVQSRCAQELSWVQEREGNHGERNHGSRRLTARRAPRAQWDDSGPTVRDRRP